VLERAVRYLNSRGVDQFLDLGSGLPTARNTHEIRRDLDPGALVAYVDNDPIVLAHGRALLVDDAATTVVMADIRQPDTILGNPEITGFLDFTRPIGLVLNGILHHLNDDEDPHGVVATRSRDEITAFFDGLELVEPGVVFLPEWRPDQPVEYPLAVGGQLLLGGMARKP
jgi:hypothetical protein